MNPASLELVRSWLTQRNLYHLYDADSQSVLITRENVETAHVRVVDRPERGMMTWAIVLPFTVPDDRHLPVAEALNLLNSASFMGSWVMNTQRSEVYFRATVGTIGVQWDEAAIEYLLRVVVTTADQLGEMVRRVAKEGAAATTVLPARNE